MRHSIVACVLAGSVTAGMPAIADVLNCGATSPERRAIPSGTCASAYLLETEQAAIDAALAALSPDSCAGCTPPKVACEEVNVFTGGDIEVTTHQHPDGGWSAEACAPGNRAVWTACGPCIQPL
jgi:hypothetical protein